MPADNWGVGADDVVISGLSGRLPESDSIEEFAKNLFDGVDLVTADGRRWTPGLHGLPERSGKLKDLTHFDAAFFGVHPKQAHFMDPQLRMLLELTHEVIVDAGFNPGELRGSRTGVYVGVSNSETGQIWECDVDKINGYNVTGCCLSMFSNRLSYTFDFKGPSHTIDSACSSSAYALAQAAAGIRAGHCNAAIVAGTCLCLTPATSLNLYRLNMLSSEGRCATFDADVSGYVRAEAAVAVLLQRRRDCRRLYCTVRGARMNADGHKAQGITYPSGTTQRQLAQETFGEARLRPQDVAYVEAHGTGTKAGDLEEVNAIAELFCEGRTTPLLVGSVKSNMGHAEAASGLCSIAKLVVAMERGVIPGNLHYRTPNPDIPSLSDGRIKVVDRNTPWQGGVVAVNSFGFGGANAHVILESQGGARPPPASHAVPRLVLASGRTEAAVLRLLTLAADHPRDAELHALLDAVHARAITGHTHRGFAVLNAGRDASPVLEAMELDATETRPVWFVFPGMASQWAGMARALMRLPIFAASIARSAAALRPLGLDLTLVVTEAPDAAFDNVVNSMVSITAVQVALVDVLRELGVRPDGIIGASAGEIGCAYADDALTAEQAVLCAYWRGRSILDASLPPGAMAAVGLSWEEAARRCPPDVFPACHNSADNVTVSGPPESVEKFEVELRAVNLFASRVNSSGVAFHSKYVAAAAPQLRAKLLEVIPKPRPRSPRWVSSSLTPDQQDSEWGKLSSAEYYVHNLLSPVWFADVLQAVPERAIVVEIAPHALLHAVLRNALPSATHVPLVRRDHPDPLTHLLGAIGWLFAAGAQPHISSLYPPVSWPVSRGTPTLASAVEWDHSAEWSVADFKMATRTGENVIEFDLDKTEQAFLAGHNIDGRVIFPAAGYLVTNKVLLEGLDCQRQLVLGANVLARHDPGALPALAATLGAQGHVLLEEPAHALDKPGADALLKGAQLVVVARHHAEASEYVLLRRATAIPTTHIVLEVRDNDFMWVEKLHDAMKRAEKEDLRVYIWSSNTGSGVIGLGTCLHREVGGDKLRVYYLPGAKDVFDPAAPAYRAQVQLDLTFNVLRAGVWGTYRHLLLDDPANTQLQVKHAYVNILTRGDLSSLRWIESDLQYVAAAPQRAHTDLCRVYYASLNFRDIMLATGKLPPDALPGNLAGQECILGLEFSGRSSSGKRVMGMVAAKGLATNVIADKGFMWEVPDAWSLEEAATVPVAYATAYYALVVRGRMRHGDTVLVHAGSGGVGQAAISIALHAGCTVFATVGTPDKRIFLCERFPTLPGAHIGNSRDCSFEQLVRDRTGGRGVDLVLNSLAGKQLQASLRCLAVGGRFLEIGKLDLSANSPLGMAVLLKNTTVHGILLDALFDVSQEHPEKVEVVRCVTEGICNGAVLPLPATIYADCQLEQAFRYMATGKHIGKVLVRVRAEEAGGQAPAPRLLPALPRTYVHPAKSYVLVGGLGGFGLELGDWLITRGARTLVLNSRSGVRTGYQAWRIRRWREAGVRVDVSTLDATTVAGARALLAEAARAAPVGGIFNLAAVLRNAFLENLTPDDFIAVAKPKIDGTCALDVASRELAPELDHFVVLSSVACGRGSVGQSNYGLANSAMERLCEQRQADGLPALAVQYGPIGDVGLIVTFMHGDLDTVVFGSMPQRIASCLNVLGALMALPHAVTASTVVADKRRAKEKPSQEIAQVVANILGIKDTSKISNGSTLAALGMDSLTGTEIQQTLERGYDMILGVQELRVLTFGELRSMGSGASALVASEKVADRLTE